MAAGFLPATVLRTPIVCVFFFVAVLDVPVTGDVLGERRIPASHREARFQPGAHLLDGFAKSRDELRVVDSVAGM